jgi:hypothetical protein
LLNQSPQWQPLHLETGRIALGTNCVRMELECRELTGANLEVLFEVHAGWLVAGIAEPGWLNQLPAPQAQALLTAVAGLYKLAGVDLVREQIETALGTPPPSYTIEEDGLRVRVGADAELVYDLRNGPMIPPQVAAGAAPEDWPALPAHQVLFKRVPVTWAEWVQTWEAEECEAFCRFAQGLGPAPRAKAF